MVALWAFGIQTANSRGYNTQFGIALNKRIPQKIEIPAGQNLLAENGGDANAASAINEAALLEHLQFQFDIGTDDIDMLIMPMPELPPQQAPVVILSATAERNDGLYGTVGVCTVSPKTEQMDAEKERDGNYFLSPRVYASNIFALRPPVSGEPNYEQAEVTVLRPPMHGTLSGDFSPEKHISYYPTSGYVGNDKVVFLVNIDGYKVKVEYLIKIRDQKDLAARPAAGGGYCPDPNWWISSLPTRSHRPR
jgi:hypothetical protein